MSRRTVAAGLAACAAALTAHAQPAAAAEHRVGAPDPLQPSSGELHDVVLEGGRGLRRALARTGWGGQYTGHDGSRVTIYVSDVYAVDHALNQDWAEFVTGLVHGAELPEATFYLAPPDELHFLCGSQLASGCYSLETETIVVPGEDDPVYGVTVEEVMRHEYGHHVAANRVNTPWDALDWGTKRWASHANVCARVNDGSVFPGDQGDHYHLNPGEAFAETYRIANEQRAGTRGFTWTVVDRSFFPDQPALDFVVDDVLRPWLQNGSASRSGTLTRRRGARFYRLRTAFDGPLELTLTAPAGAAYRLALVSKDHATRFAQTAAGRQVTLSVLVCGERVTTIGVYRVRGSGTFELALSLP